MKRTPKIRMDYTDWTVEQHAEHLRTHPDYQAYYANYNAPSVEEFIEKYAKEKRDMYKEKDNYQYNYDAHQTQFLKGADEFIDMILQKKLFNLQCQWRAGLIELPLVDVSYDFNYWETDIRGCPFIPPITQEEIDLCLRYLKEEMDYSDCLDPYDFNWQGYEKFKNQLIVKEHEDADEGDLKMDAKDLPSRYNCQELPDLYIFFDTFQNTAHFLELPDVKYEKELLYVRKGYRMQEAQKEAELKAEGKWQEPKPYVKEEKLPNLYCFESTTAEFIEAVEDADTKAIFKLKQYSKRSTRRTRDENSVYDDIEFLEQFDEDIPVEAHWNWRGAISRTVRKFKQTRISEMLPYAYDTYLLEFDEDKTLEETIANRVAHYKYDTESNHAYYLMMQWKKEFFDGRKALDEERL